MIVIIIDVMVDESQLLFLHAASGTLSTKDAIKDMWETLIYHIRNAKYVRFYDGSMERITMDALKVLGISDASVVRMPATAPNNGRTMYIKSVARNMEQIVWLKNWAVAIGKQVAAGKNGMVFYPFKVEKRYWPSMHQIMSTTCNHGGIDENKDTIMHYGDMDGEEKALIVSDLNMHQRKRVVMTNAAVTAGVGFTSLWFHRLYACVPGF